LYTTCDGVKVIENQKLWSIVAIVMKEILQSTSNVMGMESNQLVSPQNPKRAHSPKELYNLRETFETCKNLPHMLQPII